MPSCFPVSCICTSIFGRASNIKQWDLDNIHPSLLFNGWKPLLNLYLIRSWPDPGHPLKLWDQLLPAHHQGISLQHTCVISMPSLSYNQNYLRSSGVMYLKWKLYISVAQDLIKKLLSMHLPVLGIQHTVSLRQCWWCWQNHKGGRGETEILGNAVYSWFLTFADSFYMAPSLNLDYFVDVTKLHTVVFV